MTNLCHAAKEDGIVEAYVNIMANIQYHQKSAKFSTRDHGTIRLYLQKHD